ncbi:MAG: hypothetical protein FVQ80_06990 [Planctomycetes bacterium]|nr:hypothetical protein [Planctomycetota bacterium]
MIRNRLGVALRDMHESSGNAGTVEAIEGMLEKGELNPNDFSLKECWEAFERDPQTGLVRDISEAVSTDMFPKITGVLISATLIKAYNSVKTIGKLLTHTVKSNMEIETYAGFNAVEMPEEVQQGAPYNDSGIGEKFVTVPHQKYGRIISITEEMIYFDKTNQIIARAKGIGKKAAQYKERLIVNGVQDINTNVYRPSGVAAAFYRTTAVGDREQNSRATTPFGEVGLREAFKLMHIQQDENDDYITIDPANVYAIFPFDLWVEAVQMQKSTLVPEGTENAVNIWKGAFTPITSPYVTVQSATTWFLGDFAEDFIWSEVWPLQTFSSKPGHEDEFNKDIKAKHKVRFYGQVAALDDKHAYKFTA